MDKFVELMAKGAAVVGIQVERLWPQVITAYWIETLGQFFVGPFMVALLLVIARRCWQVSRSMKAAHPYHYYEGHMGFVVMASISWGGAAVIGAVYCLLTPTWVAILLRPEAMYVRSLLGK